MLKNLKVCYEDVKFRADLPTPSLSRRGMEKQCLASLHS